MLRGAPSAVTMDGGVTDLTAGPGGARYCNIDPAHAQGKGLLRNPREEPPWIEIIPCIDISLPTPAAMEIPGMNLAWTPWHKSPRISERVRP